MNKPKILLYSDGVLFGGSEYVVVNILKNKELASKYDFLFAYRKHKDYQSHIDSLFNDEEKAKLFPLPIWSFGNAYIKISSNVKFTLIKNLLIKLFSFILRLQIINIHNYFVFRRFFNRTPFELIHANNVGYPGSESCLVAAKVAKNIGRKVVLQINNNPSTTKRYWDPIVKKTVDKIVIASKYTSNNISSIRNITDNNIYTLRDQVRFVEPSESSDSLRRKLGIDKDAIVLIQVALLLRYKGQIHILEALTSLRESAPDFYNNSVLVLIGTGEMEKELKQYIINNNLKEHVIMYGYRNDYIDYINMADIMVHPTRANEDMPLIIMSAMSLGKPVISCRLAGIPEEIEHMKSGILLDPSSSTFVEDLCSAIKTAYENRMAFGERGKEKYESEFSESNYVEGLSTLYESLL